MPVGEEYTLVDRDEGPCDCWLTVTYTDDDGYHEQVESERIGVVAPRANSPAISAPVITGTAQVGETLTADTTGIADADGLSGTTFTYQWVANDGTADTDIAGATDSTYTLVADDEGKTIKVRVSFTDDAGNDETLTSTATDTVSHAIQQQTSYSPATGAPVITGTAQVGETLTADTSRIADNDGLNSVSYSYQWIRIDGLSDTDIAGGTDSSYTLVADDQGKTIKMRVSFTDDAGNNESLTSAATATVAARPNTPATGAPAITGTVQVGETLTADTSGIADDDGLTNVSYSYQWIRNDGSTDTDITSATGSNYTLVEADEGRAIKVRVSFIDDAGNAESLTSAATAMVKVRQWKMSASWRCGIVDWTNLDVRGCDIQDQIVFNFILQEAVNDDDPSTVDYVLRIDMLHENGTDANECEGTNMGTDIEVTTVDDEVVIGRGSLGHADCEPGVYKVRFSAREGASATWYSNDSHDLWLRWPNEAAMGKPTIAGTAQVGETLTADSSSIVDDNGLSGVTFGYQWIRNDGSSDTDITSGTDSTYTLVAADEGNTIKVRVSFTDDDEYTESLTSDATEAVSFAIQQQVANTPATGVPAITGTSQMGEMLTADISGIADDDGLESVSYSYQWVRNDGSSDTDITTATDSTYTLVAADEGKTIKVRVSFTDDRGYSETVTSAATAAVAAPEPPAKPTGLSTVSVSHDAVTLTWDNPQDDSITGYVILRRDREIHPVGTFVTITGDTGSADTTYTDDSVEPEKQYNYKIKAINEYGKVSKKSHWVRADTPAVTVPDKPTGLSAAVSHDTVTLTWDDPQDDSITGYVILRRDRAIHPTGTFVTIAGDTGSADTTYTDDSVEPDKEYVYRIKAINEHGEMSERSHWVRGFTPAAPPTDSPATGEPTITGTAQVGQTLTVDTSGIADADGLDNAVFAYQWLSDDAEIRGATGSTYTLVDDDEGQTITVRVTVTDDLGNETTLTSAATEAVEAAPQSNSPATGEPTIAGTAQVGQTLTVDTSGIADEDGLDNAVFAYQWLSDDAEIGGATGSTYTLVDDDEGRTIKVRVTVTDDLGNETTLTSAATEAVEAKRNTAATGRPTISGTVRVGETLTADTTGIADADGLTNVSYRYQWVVTDGGAHINISGETGATYTLVSADRGLRILVRVTFTDDAGKRERLTSAATDVVAAAP